MCWIGHLECETCGVSIDTHIADFCVKPETVHLYCGRCAPKLLGSKGLRDFRRSIARAAKSSDDDTTIIINGRKVFIDVVTARQVRLGGRPSNGIGSPAYPGGHVGMFVLFVCDNPKAYGVCING